jgi:hypothetical protein
MMDPLKSQTINAILPPRTLHQLQSLQEKVKFLHHFVSDFSTCANGLLILVPRHPFLVWWPRITIFWHIKTHNFKCPINHHTIFKKDFILCLSTSIVTISKVLAQLGEDVCKHVIYYARKNLLCPPTKVKSRKQFFLGYHPFSPKIVPIHFSLNNKSCRKL